MSKRRRLTVGLAVAAATGALFCLALSLNLFHSLQLQSSDFLFRAANLYQEAKPSDKIVIVGIDDKSLARLGHLSRWSRAHYAQIIDILVKAKARVIVFDIIFAEPATGDEEMAAAIKSAGNIVLSSVFVPAAADTSPTKGIVPGNDLVKPLSSFAEVAFASGQANVSPDVDGVVRRLPVAIRHGDGYEPALALAAVARYLNRPTVNEILVTDNTLPFAGREIPLTSGNEMLINYVDAPRGTGGTVSFQMASFIDVLDGETSPALFEDKIVIIGYTAGGLGDTLWTPMGVLMNGIQIHATAIHTILKGNFLKPAPFAITILSILAVALLCGLVVLRLRTLWATLLSIFLFLFYFLLAFSLFDNGIMMNVFYPPLAIIGTFVGVNLFNIVVERSERSEITRTFGRYLSPSVVAKILATLDKGGLSLGGEEHEVTVMFADVRGFSGISERLRPEELVELLNTYLSVVIEAVIKHSGVINKFGGDSLMAVWNVPIECRDHAMLAVSAAVSAQRMIVELHEKRPAMVKMEFGIGINTGKAIAGNMGDEDRLEYSVIGDAVNIAARLASISPGGRIWIGADTLALVKDDVRVRPLEPLSVKGKLKPVEAYELETPSNMPADGKTGPNSPGGES